MSQRAGGDGAGGGGGLLTFGVVRRWHAGPVEASAARLRACVDQIVRAGDGFEAGSGLVSCSGETVAAARARREQILEQARRHVATATSVYRGLYDAAGDLTAVEHAVADVEATAAARRLRIGDDGSVHDLQPPAPAPDPQDPAAQAAAAAAARERRALMQDLADQVARVVEQAAAVDARLTNVLVHGRAGVDDGDATTLAQARAAGSTPLSDALAAAGLSAVPENPEGVASFWASLTPELRDALIHDDPHRWGNLDGVPTTDRDTANKISLDVDLADGRAFFTEHGIAVPGSAKELENLSDETKEALGLDDAAHALRLRRYRNALTISGQLVSSTRVPAFLHTYDAGEYGGDGRGAIAFGNPDTATNLAVAVPGFDSRVDSIGAVAGDARRLYLSANAQNVVASPGHPATTAVVAWVGYNAPDPGGWGEGTAVARQDKAAAGAKELASAVRGLRANFRGAGKLTVIGHSYGSTTTGLALQKEHLADYADQVVLIGSPGVGAQGRTAADLGLDHDRLFVGSASRDKVTTVVQDFGGALGADPATKDFGATRFRAENIHRGEYGTDEGGWLDRAGDYWGDVVKQDHTAYYDSGTQSESMAALTHVVNGHADDLQADGLLAEPRIRERGFDPMTGDPSTTLIDPEYERVPETGKMSWMTAVPNGAP